MRKKYTLGIFFLLAVFLDQLTKYWVRINLSLGDVKEIIPGFFNIRYVFNPGAAFGILRKQPENLRIILFLSVTFLSALVIIYLIFKEYQYKVRVFAYTSILAGAVGNAIDRARFGMVVDFLDFYYKDFHWYFFNIADCFITVGVFVLLIESIFFNKVKS